MWGQCDPKQSFQALHKNYQYLNSEILWLRLSIVFSFQIMFSDSTQDWHPYNHICIEVQLVDLAQGSFFSSTKYCFNCKINVRSGFFDPKNLGKDTKIDYLPQIVRKLYMEYWRSCSFDSDGQFVFCPYNTKVTQVWWSGIHLILVHDILSTFCFTDGFISVGANSDSVSGFWSDHTQYY